MQILDALGSAANAAPTLSSHPRAVRRRRRRRRPPPRGRPRGEVGGHVAVAGVRVGRSQGGWPAQVGWPSYGRHVDVSEGQVSGNRVRVIFRRDLIKPAGDQRRILRRHDALRAQHGHMGL